MTSRSKNNHCVIDSNTAEFWCQVCDVREPASIAFGPVAGFLASIDKFAEEHAACAMNAIRKIEEGDCEN